jgi:hypothetical protein
VFTPANAAPVRAPAPGSRPLPLPARRGGGALLPWHVVGAPVWPRPPLGWRSGGAFSYSLSRRSHRWGGKGKTQWGWWRWTTGSLPPPLLLNPGAARAGRNPYAAPAWTARASVAAPPPLSARARSQGRGVGVKEDFPPPVWVRFACGRARSLGVRVA